MEESAWLRVRSLFPVLQQWAYLNTAAFGALPTPAREAVQAHFAARDARAALDFLDWYDRLDGLRAKLAGLIGAQPADIGFCPSAGAALSWLLRGIEWRAGDEILTSADEFPNSLYAPMALSAQGVRLRKLPAAGRRVSPDELLDALAPRTRLVVLSTVNYSSGLRTPLREVAPELRRRGVLLCIDGSQSVGALRHDIEEVPADFLMVSGYKWMLAPPGAGFFHAPQATRAWLPPSIVSWRSDRRWRDVDHLHHGSPEPPDEAAVYEGGIQPFALLFALEASVDLILACGPEAIERRVLGLAAIAQALLEQRGGVLPEGAGGTPIVAAAFPGRDLAALCGRLRERRVAASLRQGSLRISPHFFNSEEDLERLDEALAT